MLLNIFFLNEKELYIYYYIIIINYCLIFIKHAKKSRKMNAKNILSILIHILEKP